MKETKILAFVLLAACGGPAVQQVTVQPAGTNGDAGAASVTATDMRARIGFLASDALRGRDTPSPGLEVAAAYIASEFQRMGLEPRGGDGGFLQRYPYTIRRLRSDSVRLTIATSGEPESLVFGRDFFVWAGTPAVTRGELVFAGAKIEPAAQLRGRVAVVEIAGALDRAWRTAVVNARNAATTGGAAALIVVLDSTITEADVRQRATAFSTTMGVSPVVSTIFLRRDLAGEVLRQRGTAYITAPVAEVVHRPPNVVAVLPGSDPELRNTYVVLSAHMDHVGVGAPNAQGDSIYNGADDDASGTAAVLEVAEALASLPTRPARSVLFLTVSGEEKGLLGSQHFAEHPTVPLQSIVANINIDMIARNAPDTVVAIGQEYSSLGPLVRELVRRHPELGLTASKDIWPQERFFFRSDHYSFAKKEIPAIFFFSGVHEDYHRPSDEVTKIDADKAARIARLTYYLTQEIANGREAPKWTEEGLKEVRALTR